ncbi:hypothetical protein [Flavobacterium sp. JP2137]|uniref:hypothetical protein n=1 Tax=Flavobacterium sp. JP2137 TaxID=3414510 RepID=UPI003D2FD5A3
MTIRERLQDDDGLTILINQALTKSIGLSGMKEKTDQLMLDEIIKMLFTVYDHLTPDEIYKAFELERMRMYETKTEHFQLFDTGYAAEILKKYLDWKIDIKTKYNITKSNSIPENTLLLSETSDSEKKKIMDQAITRCFDEFNKQGKINHPFKHVFDELVDRKFIKKATEDTPRLKQWYDERRIIAHAEVEKELLAQAEINKDNSKKVKSIREELNLLLDNKSDKVEIKLFEIVLREFFQKRIDLKLPIEELLK